MKALREIKTKCGGGLDFPTSQEERQRKEADAVTWGELISPGTPAVLFLGRFPVADRCS